MTNNTDEQLEAELDRTTNPIDGGGCPWCGKRVNKKYGSRSVFGTDLYDRAAIIFCSEDCREDYQHYHA